MWGAIGTRRNTSFKFRYDIFISSVVAYKPRIVFALDHLLFSRQIVPKKPSLRSSRSIFRGRRERPSARFPYVFELPVHWWTGNS